MNLPNQIVDLISSYCDIKTRVKLSQTCKNLKYVLNSPIINDMLNGNIKVLDMNHSIGRKIIHREALNGNYDIVKLFCKYIDPLYKTIINVDPKMIEFIKSINEHVIHEYNFTLPIEEHQPSGSVDMSRVFDTTLVLSFPNPENNIIQVMSYNDFRMI